MNNQQKQQVLEQINKANNVLVTVSNSPTVDGLAASIALTLLLNKMGKHATTVFSGVVPSTIEFLQPEKTIETTTDSLRDFIIALDKSKADKLRYKVENDVVRIFITPYKTSITQNDLEYTQGDFNVDLVIAIGVTKQSDLDIAITAHGRILHDAVVSAINNRDTPTELGTMNWQELQASSLCEMIAMISYDLKPEMIDGQMATSLLTGIIAETDRFKNDKTSPVSLQLSSQLMSAGANQQLIAEKLEEPTLPPVNESLNYPAPDHQPANSVQPIEQKVTNNGELEISHADDEEDVDKIHIDEHGNLEPNPEEQQNPSYEPPATNLPNFDDLEDQPEEKPAEAPVEEQEDAVEATNEESNVDPELAEDASTDEQSKESSTNTPLRHQMVINPLPQPGDAAKSDKPFDLQAALQSAQEPEEPTEKEKEPEFIATPAPVEETSPAVEVPEVAPQPIMDTPAPAATESPGDTLADLEKAVGSPHLDSSSTSDSSIDALRSSVASAVDSVPSQFPKPDVALGAQSVEMNSVQETPQPESAVNDAPPVPPPMTPMFYDSSGQNANPFLNPDNK